MAFVSGRKRWKKKMAGEEKGGRNRNGGKIRTVSIQEHAF
jgi:hypothetical protein